MTRRRVVLSLLIVWTALWLGTFLVPALLAPTGDGFTRGLNRLGTFLGFQCLAGLVGLGLLAIRPLTGRLRWLALVPVGLTGLLGLGIVGLILWARVSSPEPPPTLRPKQPPTEARPQVAPPAEGTTLD